jgi:hypothetical protein
VVSRLAAAGILIGGAGYVAVMAWLAMRSRVFMDEIWTIEYGRVFLEPGVAYSMYMLADGTSLKAAAWLGPVLAESIFRVSGSVSAFRIVNAAAMLVVAAAVYRLARNRGLEARLALLVVVILALDPTLVQSIVLGRADALALALAVGGLALADTGVAGLLAGRRGWLMIAFGYSACVLSVSIWISAALLGPLIFAHWLSSWIRVQRSAAMLGRSICAFMLPPALTAILMIDFVHIWEVGQAHAANPLFTASTTWEAARRIPELLSVSALLVIPGLVALLALRPRWLALTLAVGVAVIFSSGFYPFRIPFLLIYCVASMVLLMAQASAPDRRAAWRLYLVSAAAILTLLLGLRVVFGLNNEVRLDPERAWTRTLPAQTRIADYSWDFYESARHHGLQPMRSFPGDDGAQVLLWLNRFQPDVVVRAVDATGTFVLVEDLDDKLRRAGYCSDVWIDGYGHSVSPDMVPRAPPSPLLWRLGLFRDHGPYAIWRRCAH